MNRTLPAVAVLAGLVWVSPTLGQERPASRNVGQFFPPIIEPIGQEDTETLRAMVLAYLERTAAEGDRPILVFELRPGDAAPGESTFGSAIELTRLLTRELGGAKQTVAYVPEPLSGFAVLPVLACDEIVLGPKATLGPIAPEGRLIPNHEREALRDLAIAKGRDVDLLLGLLEPSRDLRQVRTGDGATHFVFAENLPEFRKTHQVLEEKSAWEGRRGVLTTERARQTIARLQAEDRARIAEVYGLPSTAVDPTMAAIKNPALIQVHGPIHPRAESFLIREIQTARRNGSNLIFFEINSEGGLFDQASKVADAISRLDGVRTVAYIDDRALGASILLALACDQIVLRKGARFGDAHAQLVGSGNDLEELTERQTKIYAERAETLARSKGRPGAIARAMVDPDAVVLRARDKEIGVVVYVLESRIAAEPNRFEAAEPVKSADGSVLTLTDETAPRFQMADRVVRDFNELRADYNLRGKTLRQANRTWVDALVHTLNEPWMRGVLLFLGFFMLVLELKLPGIGLPAVLSTLAFLLYFWSGYLGGTADMLEILLFVVGVVCLGIELFVFPGLVIFGTSGVLLILISVVMASHTFVWPTEEYEYRQLVGTIFRLLFAIIGTIVAAVIAGRFLKKMPFFRRLILTPEPAGGPELEPGQKPPPDPDAPYTFLLGEVGRTTTPLRPSGKARFGELLVDVTADGFWIGANQPVEVIEVRGSRVVVKRA